MAIYTSSPTKNVSFFFKVDMLYFHFYSGQEIFFSCWQHGMQDAGS